MVIRFKGGGPDCWTNPDQSQHRGSNPGFQNTSLADYLLSYAGKTPSSTGSAVSVGRELRRRLNAARTAEVSHPAGRLWRPTWSLDTAMHGTHGDGSVSYTAGELNPATPAPKAGVTPCDLRYAVDSRGIEPPTAG